jgi:hypothetical protein
MNGIQLPHNMLSGEAETLSEVNVDAIMRSIREANRRKWRSSLPEMAPLRFSETFPESDMALLRFHVHSLDQPSVPLEFGLELTRSNLDRLPLVGALWRLARRSLHRISLHYVRKVVGFLLPFHRHLANAAELFLHYQEQQDEALTALERRISELEARLAALEDKL